MGLAKLDMWEPGMSIGIEKSTGSTGEKGRYMSVKIRSAILLCRCSNSAKHVENTLSYLL